MGRLIKTIMPLVILLMAVGRLFATNVSGPILTDTTWTLAGSPYIVTGNVLVMNGVTLTIEPSVTVKFNSSKALQIDGTLIARGTSENKIVLTSNQPIPAPGDWGYILFSNSSTDATYDESGNCVGGSILEYAVVEYAGGVSVSNNGALRMNNAHPFINYCDIINNKSSGIYGYNLSTILKITNCNITNNTTAQGYGGGIYVSGGDVDILNCVIKQNKTTSGAGIGIGGGGVFIGGGRVTIADTAVTDNTTSGGGINAGSGSIFINRCVVSNNTSICGGGGVIGGWPQNLTINNTTISKNTVTDPGGWGYGGGGVMAYAGTFSISSCIIERNTVNTDGGGVEGGGNMSIINSIITNNEATGGGYQALGNGGGCFARSGDIITNSIIGNNRAAADGGGVFGAKVTNSIISSNQADNSAGIHNSGSGISNTITCNRCTGFLDTRTIYVSSSSFFNHSNIFNNTATYILWNDNAHGSPDANAENNWWGNATESDIQAKIYDWFDDSSKGIVDYSPYETAIRTDTPISPPTGLTVSTTDTDIMLTWAPNPEGDVAGYEVYWGTQPAPFFENVADVGNSSGHTIPGLAAGTYYVAVTAYDNDYSPANDDPDTIVNENQTNGNESWYASTVAFVGTPEPRVLKLISPNGGETLLAGNMFAINWQSEGPITDVFIEYSTNNGSDWIPTATVGNTGSYEWLVPAVASGQCLVAITDATNSAVTDNSDDVFTIIQCSSVIPGDLNKDCYVDFYDFSAFAEDWLECSNPLDLNCVP